MTTFKKCIGIANKQSTTYDFFFLQDLVLSTHAMISEVELYWISLSQTTVFVVIQFSNKFIQFSRYVRAVFEALNEESNMAEKNTNI